MNNQGYIYNCPKKCPIRKKCFIIKLTSELAQPIEVLKKCEACHGQDIIVTIGGSRPP